MYQKRSYYLCLQNYICPYSASFHLHCSILCFYRIGLKTQLQILITLISAKDKWGQVAETKKGAYCLYNDDMNNEDDYGFLYNWHAVNTDKLCPEGWKVPTLSEFMMFVNELGGEGLAGNLMKSTSGWMGYRKDELPDYQGTNGSGFDARPGGYRNDAGAFFNVTKYGYWWCSSTQNGASGDLCPLL